MERTLKKKSILLLLTCSLCWGPSYLFIKISVQEIPPITLALLRVFIGALILYAICRNQNQKIYFWKNHWKHFSIMALTLNVIPFSLISYAELYISSSLAGILNSFTLIFTTTLAHFFGTYDSLNKNKILGVVIGLLGLGVVYSPSFSQNNIKNEIGVLLMIFACLSYGSGTIYVRTHLQKVPGLIALTWQLIFASIFLVPLSLIIDHSFTLDLPSPLAILGAIGLGIFGTAAGFFFYYKTIQKVGPTYASLSVLLVPIFAIILGVVFLNEKLSWHVYIGTLLILSSVASVNPAMNKNI